MKIKNVIKALEKLDLVINKSVAHHFSEGHCTFFYSCKSNKNCVEWYEQKHDNGEVKSVYIRGINHHDDLMTDYFAGSFYDTIKSVVNVMSE